MTLRQTPFCAVTCHSTRRRREVSRTSMLLPFISFALCCDRITREGTAFIRRSVKERPAKLLEQGKASPGSETDSIIYAVRERFRKLAVTIDIRNLLEDYLHHLASPDTETLQRFLSER